MLEDKRILVTGGFGYLGSWMARYLKEDGAWVKILARRIPDYFEEWSKNFEMFIGEDNYILVEIPPYVINGFKGIGIKPAIVANCATHPHCPEEIFRIDPFDNEFPYDWSVKHG